MESLYLKSYSYKSMKEYYELKKKLNLYIEEKTVIEAKELGLNISKVCENSLKLVIEQMKSFYNQNKPNSISQSTKNSLKSLERALIPRPAAYKAAALPGWAIEAYTYPVNQQIKTFTEQKYVLQNPYTSWHNPYIIEKWF